MCLVQLTNPVNKTITDHDFVCVCVSQIRYISQTQGIPAEHMLNNATKTTKFFYRDNESTYPFWRLKVTDALRIVCCVIHIQ